VAERKVVPVHFFRYEDMLTDPLGVLKGVFAFMLGIDDIEGTFIWHRIQQVVAQDKKTRAIYTPRSGGVIKNMGQFTQEQLDHMIKQSAHFIRFFNYSSLLKNLTDEQKALLTSDSFEPNFLSSNLDHQAWYLANKETLD